MLALAMLFLNACGGGRHEPTEIYVLVVTNSKIAYWQEAAAGLSAASRELGVRTEMAGPDTYDPKAEKEEFLRVMARKPAPAGILVSAADPEIMRDAIDSAVGAGIPVVAIDSDSPKSKRLLFIGTNNYQAGQMGGEVLLQELKGKATLAVYTITGQENLNERLEGYKRVLARRPEIKILPVIDVRGDPARAFDATKVFIDKKVVPDAFVCLEALSCPEVADVLDRGHIQGKTIVAMDANKNTLDWIEKGMIRATIAQKPYTMAYYGVRVLDDFHHAKPANLDRGSAQGSRASLPVFIDTGATLVDKSNVKSFLAPPETPR